MTARVALDTNLLIYSLDPSDSGKRSVSAAILRSGARDDSLSLSRQCLNECYRVLAHRRRLMPREDAIAYLSALEPFCRAPIDQETTVLAWSVEAQCGWDWWDCMMVAAALQTKCDVLLTEDMQDRRSVGPLIILNPFRNDLSAFLALN
jgi:predicted nucleic acid-binding protein